MQEDPVDWTTPDLDGAVAALVSAGAEVVGSEVAKGVRRIDFVLDGRSCTLVERTPKRRGEWVALDFPWPAAWPDIMLTPPGQPYQDGVVDPSPPVGHALSSHDLPAARVVVDTGFAAASIDPRADLSIEAFDGASITTDPRVALNGPTATWLLNLARLALVAAPPVDPDDDVVGRVHPDMEESSATVHGTRPAVVHRLLWLLRIRHDEDDVVVVGPLRQALDLWIVSAARLATNRRTGTLHADDAREAVGMLLLTIADTLWRSGVADPVEAQLSERVHTILSQARAWDAAANTTTMSRP